MHLFWDALLVAEFKFKISSAVACADILHIHGGVSLLAPYLVNHECYLNTVKLEPAAGLTLQDLSQQLSFDRRARNWRLKCLGSCGIRAADTSHTPFALMSLDIPRYLSVPWSGELLKGSFQKW